METQPQAPFVWLDQQGEGRNVHVYFRREFVLDQLPARAELNLFADSRYHLYVNGAFVQYGPVRFYPEHPQFDTHDIASHLRIGRNVVAVHVASWGMETFHHLKTAGAFAAWGKVANVSFSTASGWKCRRAEGYDATAPKFSFAQAPLHLHDAHKDCPDWTAVDCAPAGWTEPVPLANTSAWGPLEPRQIPLLTQNVVSPRVLLGAYALPDDEFVCFRVNGNDLTTEEFGRMRTIFAYSWIFSPRQQDVTLGVHWGEHYLSGAALKKTAVPERPCREEITLALNEGWNFYFIKYGLIWGAWDSAIAVPKNSGLIFAADKSRTNNVSFYTAGPFTTDEEKTLAALKLPFASPDDLPKLSAGWIPQQQSSVPGNPGIAMASMKFVTRIEHQPAQISNLRTHGPEAPGTNVAFVFDFGRRTLGRVFVDYEAPAGTVIDAGYSEDFKDEQPNVLRRAGIYTAEREIARGGAGRLETFEPRGFRYLQINVTNASGPVKINNVGAVEQIYPFEQIGNFECSDPLLNEIWKLGWNALRLCAEDIYTDCPLRERTLYAGDLLPEMATTLVTSGDLRLVRRCLDVFTQHQTADDPQISGRAPATRGKPAGKVNAIHDFSLITLLIWAWYIERSGDTEFARKLYGNYRRLLENALENRAPDGLFPHGGAFIEWVEFDRGTINACVHALLTKCFSVMGKIAGQLGEKADEKRYAQLSADVAALTRERFWDSSANAFHDGFRDGKQLTKHHPCSSAWPAIFGATAPGQAEAIKAHLEKHLAKSMTGGDRTVSSYGGFYVLAALYQFGQIEVAESFMRREWGRMAIEGSDTVWENFDPGASLCHAWAGAPTFHLSTKVLGVPLSFPELASSEEMVITPRGETIEWARGTVPHAAGPIRIEWKIDGEHLRIHCDVPKGIKWRVEPAGRLAKKTLWVNGKRSNQ